MRTDAIFKRAYNQILTVLNGSALGTALKSEHGLARQFGISRTTVRKILESLVTKGVVAIGDDGPVRVLVRHAGRHEFFPDAETSLVSETAEIEFMKLVQAEEIRPGQKIATVELARKLQVSPSSMREYLNSFNQFGLLERHSNGSWTFRGIDRDFVCELSDVRELFELQAAERICELPAESPFWQKLAQLESEHLELLQQIDARYADFSHLDREFHTLIASAMSNRFVNNFNAIRTFVFHYHYQWSRGDEKARNDVAIREHIHYIRALFSRDRAAIRAAVLAHLRTARGGLLASLERARPLALTVESADLAADVRSDLRDLDAVARGAATE